MLQNKLLILEDDLDLQINLVAYFEDEGFECTGAESAEEALNYLRENLFDLAIVDIGLPNISGEEFITIVNKEFPSLKFVIYTGQPDFNLSNRLKSIDIKENHLFRKPIFDYSLITKELLLLTS